MSSVWHPGLIVLAITVFANLMLGIFVLLRDSRNATNRLFFLLVSTMSIWSVFNYLSDYQGGVLVYARLVLFTAVPFASVFYLFVHTFPNARLRLSRLKLLLIGLNTVVAMALTLTPLVFAAIQQSGPQAGSPVVGPAIPIFAATVIFYDLGGVLLLIRKTRRSRRSERQQRLYLALGLTIMLSGIILFNFLFPVLVKNTAFITYAAAFTFPFAAFTTYAIVRHRLLDIRAVVARSVAYTLLLLTLTAVYALLIFGVSGVFFPHAGFSSTQQALFTILAVAMAFSFQPLRRFFERLTDRLFFRNGYDTQQLLNELGKILIDEFQLDRLLRLTLIKLCEQLQIDSAQFYIFNRGSVYRVEHYGTLPHRLITVPHLEKLHHNLIVADELQEGRQLALMTEFGFRVVSKLHTNKEFVGYLMLGDKRSGDIYSSQDINVIQIFCQEVAVAISNAKAYQEIANFNATLQQKVDDATKQLQVANRHLKELDKAKDDFISLVSHQLRTPLTGINNYLSMVLEGDAGKVNKQQKEFLEHAYLGSHRASAMISDLLNVSRMTAGRFKIERKPTDLEAMAREEVRQLSQSAIDKGLLLRFLPPKHKLPPLELDEDKTRQVVMNFIDNAIYYTQKGEIRISLDAADGKVELRVADSGIGVPKAAQHKLFNKFYRAGNAQEVRPNGTGLGLYLAKRVIEDQGGTIIFESTEGKGSTFGFSMPVRVSAPKSRPRKELHAARR